MENNEIVIRKKKRKEITFEQDKTIEDIFIITVWKDNWEDTSIVLNKKDVQKMMDFVNKKNK